MQSSESDSARKRDAAIRHAEARAAVADADRDLWRAIGGTALVDLGDGRTLGFVELPAPDRVDQLAAGIVVRLLAARIELADAAADLARAHGIAPPAALAQHRAEFVNALAQYRAAAASMAAN